MDYTYGGAQTHETGAQIVVAAERKSAPHESELNEQLNSLKKCVLDQKKRMAHAFLRIEAAIHEARQTIPASKLKTFLVAECGLNRSDLNTYLRFDKAAIDRRLVEKHSLPFAVIKALVSAPDVVRDEAIERIQLGSFVHSSDITAIKRRLADQAKDPAVERERRRLKSLRVAAERRAERRLESFCEDFIGFAQFLIDFYNDGYEDRPRMDEFRANRDRLITTAGECLVRFESTFDVESLPPPEEYGYHEHTEEAVRLSRAYHSLKRFAAGNLLETDSEGCPYEQYHPYLDTSDVEDIIWLFNSNGISKEDLKPRRVPARPVARKAVKPPHRLTSLEICAGAGGQALGLHAAGFDALGLYEKNPYAAKTLDMNRWLGPVHCADIREVDFTRYRGVVDLVAGGVPCQPHSTIGKKEGRHDERDLFMEAVRVVEEVQPKAFFFENVEGFAQKDNTGYRADLFARFADLGYESQVFSFYGSDYGLPQLRPRVAFIGFRDIPIRQFRMPPVFPAWEKTVGESLLDIVMSNGWERERAETWARVYANRRGSTIVGGSERSGRQSFSANLRIKDWLDMGIDPNGMADKAPPPGHPVNKPFKFTLAMGARLQGFPDDWEFAGSERSDKQKKVQKRQIANALPPIMAQAVGLAIYSALTGVEFDYERALQNPELPPQRATGLGRLMQRRDLADYRKSAD